MIKRMTSIIIREYRKFTKQPSLLLVKSHYTTSHLWLDLLQSILMILKININIKFMKEKSLKLNFLFLVFCYHLDVAEEGKWVRKWEQCTKKVLKNRKKSFEERAHRQFIMLNIFTYERERIMYRRWQRRLL